MAYDFGSNLDRILSTDDTFGAGTDIFGNPTVPSTPTPMANTNFGESLGIPDDSYDPAARLNQLYHPDTRMSDMFYNMLQNPPVREQPGLARKILSGFAALSGNPNVVEHSLYPGYERELSDYETRLKPLEEASNIERQNNANMRSVANQIISQEMGERRLERQMARDRQLAGYENQNLNLRSGRYDTLAQQAQQRIDIDKARLNGGKLYHDDAGNAFLMTNDGRKLSVDANYLSAEQKNEMIRNREIDVAKIGAKTRAEYHPDRVVKGTSKINGKDVEGTFNLDTNVFTPATIAQPKPDKVTGQPPPVAEPATPQKGESGASAELAKSRAMKNNALTFKAQNPDLAKYVVIDKQGNVTIKRPSILPGYPNQVQYDKIKQSLFGTSAAASTTKPTATTANKVRVRLKSDVKGADGNIHKAGTTGTVDASDPGIKSGLYEIIQ